LGRNRKDYEDMQLFSSIIFTYFLKQNHLTLGYNLVSLS
jgi:hypothetical protein